AEAALTRAIAPSRGQNRASSLEWASMTSGSVVREPGLRRDPRSASAAGSKTGALSSRVTASAGESAAVGRFDIRAPRIDGEAGVVGTCRWSRLWWRPAGALPYFRVPPGLSGPGAGLRPSVRGPASTTAAPTTRGALGLAQQARSSRRLDLQAWTIRHLGAALNDASAALPALNEAVHGEITPSRRPAGPPRRGSSGRLR